MKKLTAALLCVIMLFALCACNGRGVTVNVGSNVTGPAADYKVMSQTAYKAGDIDSIELDYSKNFFNICVDFNEGDEIRVTEYLYKDFKDLEPSKLSQKGTDLSITGIKYNGVFTSRYVPAYVSLELPESYKGSLEIKAASGDVDIQGAQQLRELEVMAASGNVKVCTVNLNNAEIQTASGNVSLEFSGCKSGALLDEGLFDADIKTASGDVFVVAHELKGEIQTASGDIEIDARSIAEELEAESASGDIELILPSDASFRYKLKTASGDITAPFVSGKGSLSGNYGSGSAEIELKTASGDIEIKLG